MAYVDGFVLPLPKSNIEAYRKIATEAGGIWREHGALEYRETVVFAYIVYKSREHRDEVNAKVMADPRIANMDPADMPFDGKRMVYGGFDTLVEA